MATISFGNINTVDGKTTIGGTSSGIDTAKLTEGLVAVKQLPITKLQDTIKRDSSQAAAFAELKGLLTTFKSAADVLRNPPGVNNASQDAFEFRTGTIVSNTSVAGTDYLTATIQPGTSAQSFGIDEITQLAKAKKQDTNIFAIASPNAQAVFAAPAAGQFGAGTFTVNGESITLDDGDSLQDVVNKFNQVSADTHISASILQVSTGNYKVIFTETTTGPANDFDLSNPATVTSDPSGVLTNITFTTRQTADPAILVIDGVTVQRDSNSIDDIISGVTLNLRQATPPGTELEFDVAPDEELVLSAISNFVDAYNQIRFFQARQNARNQDGSPKEDALLANNQTLRSLVNELSLEVTRSVEGIVSTQPSRLADIGISFVDVGADDATETPETRNLLSVDIEKLQSAISTNYAGVRGVFAFDMVSNSNDLTVFSRTNNLNVSEVSISINQTTQTYQATYDLGAGPVTVALTATPITGGGITLAGQPGTALDGLKLIYAGTGNAVIDVTFSQGIGDRLYNALDAATKPDTGKIDAEVKTLTDKNTRLQKEIDRINIQIEAFKTQLLTKFAALERSISVFNSVLSALDAQANARANQ